MVRWQVVTQKTGKVLKTTDRKYIAEAFAHGWRDANSQTRVKIVRK